ncbi:MAG TPA: myristoyl transferase, partial [Synergistaceae bacterium]|nr:myristoyl transferase [Synergistaceae bacterium]
GCDVPEDGLYCLGSTWRRDPKLCRNVREASLEGWRYAASHPEEAVALLQKKADEAGYTVNRLLLWHMLQEILPSIFPEEGDAWVPGELSRRDYERTAAMMNKIFILPEEPPPYEIFVPSGEGSSQESSRGGEDGTRKEALSHAP